MSADKKVFVVLDIDDEKLTAGFSFVPFAYRSLYTLYVDVTGVHDHTGCGCEDGKGHFGQ